MAHWCAPEISPVQAPFECATCTIYGPATTVPYFARHESDVGSQHVSVFGSGHNSAADSDFAIISIVGFPDEHAQHTIADATCNSKLTNQFRMIILCFIFKGPIKKNERTRKP
jgi:hypothetical protein